MASSASRWARALTTWWKNRSRLTRLSNPPHAPVARWQSYSIVEPRQRKSTGIESFAGAAHLPITRSPRSGAGPGLGSSGPGGPLRARRLAGPPGHDGIDTRVPRPRRRCRWRAGPFDYASRGFGGHGTAMSGITAWSSQGRVARSGRRHRTWPAATAASRPARPGPASTGIPNRA